MLVSHGYVIKEFGSIDEVSEYIKKQLTQHNLSYAKVYDHTENEMRVVVYQYHTLYTEVFIIHDDYELRRI